MTDVRGDGVRRQGTGPDVRLGLFDGLGDGPPGVLRRLEAGPDRAERGLAQLVLSLVELLRQLMERQAVRRLEAGSLSEEQQERLGDALLHLAERMDELKEVFDLTDEDLAMNLGPLADLA